MNTVLLHITIKTTLSERSQTNILSGSIYMRFQIRQNSSMVLEVRMMDAWAEELGSEWKEHKRGCRILANALFPDPEGGHMGTSTWWIFTEPSSQPPTSSLYSIHTSLFLGFKSGKFAPIWGPLCACCPGRDSDCDSTGFFSPSRVTLKKSSLPTQSKGLPRPHQSSPATALVSIVMSPSEITWHINSHTHLLCAPSTSNTGNLGLKDLVGHVHCCIPRTRSTIWQSVHLINIWWMNERHQCK